MFRVDLSQFRRYIMARKAKAAPVVVESTEVEQEVGTVGADQVLADEYESPEEVAAQDDTTSEQPSMLAAMLEQEVKPLEEVKETEVPVVKVEKNIGVGQLVRKLIADGLTNTAILKIVHEQYGNTNTTYACVAWYRNKVKKNQALTAKSTATAIVEKMLEPEVPVDADEDPEQQ